MCMCVCAWDVWVQIMCVPEVLDKYCPLKKDEIIHRKSCFEGCLSTSFLPVFGWTLIEKIVLEILTTIRTHLQKVTMMTSQPWSGANGLKDSRGSRQLKWKKMECSKWRTPMPTVPREDRTRQIRSKHESSKVFVADNGSSEFKSLLSVGWTYKVLNASQNCSDSLSSKGLRKWHGNRPNGIKLMTPRASVLVSKEQVVRSCNTSPNISSFVLTVSFGYHS